MKISRSRVTKERIDGEVAVDVRLIGDTAHPVTIRIAIDVATSESGDTGLVLAPDCFTADVESEYRVFDLLGRVIP